MIGRPAQRELFGHLPIEAFRIDEKYYVFDAGRVAFAEVDPVAFDLLTALRDSPLDRSALAQRLPQHAETGALDLALADLVELQSKGWLTPTPFRRARQHDDASYRSTLSKNMSGITVFVTTQCNLGCSYCIYGGQYEQHEKLSQQPMSWETLKSAMDFLERHSSEARRVRVDYFGGEPLLAFGMIRRAVAYLKEKCANTPREVITTITTNGTVLTPPILNFLVENQVFIQFSIDGTAAVHDASRPFKGTDRPSYARIMKNLHAIREYDESYFDRFVRVKSVIVNETINIEDAAFFADPVIRRLTDKGAFSFIQLEPHYDLANDDAYFASLDNLALLLAPVRQATSEEELCAGLNAKQRDLYNGTFGHFFAVQALERGLHAGVELVPFSKGCMTGYQEGAVNAKGDISICLKSAKGEAFIIGNVNEGRWYYDKIEHLNASFHEDWSDCASCFAQRFCDLCYEKIAGDPEDWHASRSRFCRFNREKYRRIFSEMLAIMDRNPSLWDNLPELIDEKAERIRDRHQMATEKRVYPPNERSPIVGK